MEEKKEKSKFIMVMSTAGSEEQAVTIANALVYKQLAACVNIVPSMRSIYRFHGKVWDDEEYLLIIKSTRNHFTEIDKTISELHEYEIPEILMFPIEQGKEDFLNWIGESVL